MNQSSHCSGYNVSCEGLPDGFNAHPIKRPGPYYVICLQGRVVVDGECPYNDEWMTVSFPYNGTCTHVFSIPLAIQDGFGQLPPCSPRLNGNFKFPTRPCDAYYNCQGGVATPVKCPSNTRFNDQTRSCDALFYCPDLCPYEHHRIGRCRWT